MDFEQVREAVEDYTSGICSEVYAPASHLPERVVDWIAQAFIDDYLDEGEERLPDYNDVLKGICDYLQEECSEDARYLFEKQGKIDEIKVTLDSMGYDVDEFTESDLLEIYDSAYEALSNDDEYNSAYSEAVSAAVEEFLDKENVRC